jgi:putative DNA primase/helicase
MNAAHPLAHIHAIAQWIVVRLDAQPNGKNSKLPIDHRTGQIPLTGSGGAFNRDHWLSHPQCLKRAAELGSNYTVGFVISADTGVWCLDIDNCLRADNTWSPLAQELCIALPGTAIEISQSGRGLHVWGLGELPPHSMKRTDHGIELYSDKRFIAIGSNATGSLSAPCVAIGQFAAKWFPVAAPITAAAVREGPCADWAGPTDDDELIRRALASQSAAVVFGDKASFSDLWVANAECLAQAYPTTTQGEPYDRSSADAALAMRLAFWTGRDVVRIERLMRRSALVRDKWERKDYLQHTITRACERQTQVLKTGTPLQPGQALALRKALDATADGVLLQRASDMTPEAVRWLWQNWLALGKFHVLAGPPGQGKTTIALAMMSAVSAGRPWPDGSPCTAGDVLMWSGEDDPKDTLLPRLIAMGADVQRVYFVTGTMVDGKAQPFDPARDMPSLLSKAESIGAVRLMVVDPVVSAVAGDSHKNGETRRALQPLVDLASALGAAALGISHFSKGSAGKDPTERVTGSLAFGALARVVLCAVKAKANAGADNQDKRILARAKSNIGPDDGGFEYSIRQQPVPGHPHISASVIAWGEAVCGTARDLLADAEADAEEGSQDGPCPPAEWLKLTLACGPMPASELKHQAVEAGFAWRSVQRSMRKAGVDSRRVGFGKPAEWYLVASPATVARFAPAFNGGASGATAGAIADVDHERGRP